jgi:tRNA/rRNA methyltransferase
VADYSHCGNLRVVLVRTRNPLNIGAAARAMSNFGFLHLRLVQPYEIAFREARSAVGAATVLNNAEEFDTVADAVSDCELVIGTSAISKREVQHRVLALPSAAALIRKQLASRVAVLFGSEKVGLSNQDLTHCHWLLRIPTREEHGTMNLGQAVAVCMYELARGKTPERSITGGSKRAPARDVERLTKVLLEALTMSGYSNPRTRSATEEKVRRLVRRLQLQAEDAQVLLGMLRQIAWKVRQ